MSQFETITLGVEDGIATITLNRPDRMNAFTLQMMDELIAAFDQTDADDNVRAVIVTGAGKAFCAGADLSGGADTFNYEEQKGNAPDPLANGVNRDGGGMVSLRIFRSLKPVIGAINGAAVGVGATMSLAMDIRLASEKARYGFVFARRGIVPEAASSWFISRAVGLSTALNWCMSGRLINADELERRGLVESVHAPEDLYPAAVAIAREIADNTAPVSVAMTRQMLWRMAGASHPMEAHQLDSRAVQARGASADAKEGVASFLEKRPAEYPNKVSTDMPAFFDWQGEPEFR
ncbi:MULTISPECIES: crotonase/enoyl-CoA hydratase family protein [Marinobacter]|uniref:Enoyl-CoA hydratase n=1 Tax=Marinobacter segnicrescens TaxID=430453 RepID=A0A1I0A914_9GAMM|nr:MULTISPECIES: crotonase/enoyl-CoA hydratase family protein [Marinobacter]UZD66069.1 crotonase/enoyl-CoA hydratase family protein [Marinobacter sp. AN1]SES90660.1 Enoyl-CoA hydratase [Marinobacter segnicrescens]